MHANMNEEHLVSVYTSAQNVSIVERRMLRFLLAPLPTKNYAPHSATVWCPQQSTFVITDTFCALL
jgi:hypothetical protein